MIFPALVGNEAFDRFGSVLTRLSLNRFRICFKLNIVNISYKNFIYILNNNQEKNLAVYYLHEKLEMEMEISHPAITFMFFYKLLLFVKPFVSCV